MTTPPTTGGRAHLARRFHTLRDNRSQLILRCKCGNWDSQQLGLTGTVREIEDAHRAHRVAMGETVKPRVPTTADHLKAAYRQIEELKAKLAAYENRENNA